MKKKLLSSSLAIILCCSIVAVQTACANQSTLTIVNEIAVLVPTITNAIDGVLIFTDPEAAKIVGDIGAAAQTDLVALKTAIATYQADQSSGNYTKLGAVIDSLVNSVNAQVLTANHLVNTQAQKIAFAALTGLATILAVIDAKYIAGQAPAAQKAHAAAHAATLRQMEPFLHRDVMESAAKTSGTTYPETLEYLEAIGF